MAQDTPFPRFVKFLSGFLAFSALVSWFGFIGLFLHYDATRPTMRQPNQGRNYPSNNHGHVVYLSEQDEHQLHLLEGAAVWLFVTGVVLDCVQRRQLMVKEIRRFAVSTLHGLVTPTSWLASFRRFRQHIVQTWNGNETKAHLPDSANRGDAISLYTAKDISECQRTVRSAGYSAFGIVLESFDGYKFRLSVRRSYRNSFAPLFSGRLIPQTTGTKVEMRFGMRPFVKIFLAFWFTGVVTIGGMIFVDSIGQTLSRNVSDNSDTLIGIVMPPILLAFGFLLVRFGNRIGRDEETYVLSWLERSFADTTQNPGSEH